MSTDQKKDGAAPAAAPKQEEKPRPKRVMVKLLRKVAGIPNNVGEICGFDPATAAKLLDKTRPGGPAAEMYEPPKK
jgi:hypothetical protein